jgi:hypothetical protein
MNKLYKKHKLINCKKFIKNYNSKRHISKKKKNYKTYKRLKDQFRL